MDKHYLYHKVADTNENSTLLLSFFSAPQANNFQQFLLFYYKYCWVSSVMMIILMTNRSMGLSNVQRWWQWREAGQVIKLGWKMMQGSYKVTGIHYIYTGCVFTWEMAFWAAQSPRYNTERAPLLSWRKVKDTTKWFINPLYSDIQVALGHLQSKYSHNKVQVNFWEQAGTSYKVRCLQATSIFFFGFGQFLL